MRAVIKDGNVFSAFSDDGPTIAYPIMESNPKNLKRKFLFLRKKLDICQSYFKRAFTYVSQSRSFFKIFGYFCWVFCINEYSLSRFARSIAEVRFELQWNRGRDEECTQGIRYLNCACGASYSNINWWSWHIWEKFQINLTYVEFSLFLMTARTYCTGRWPLRAYSNDSNEIMESYGS